VCKVWITDIGLIGMMEIHVVNYQITYGAKLDRQITVPGPEKPLGTS